MKEYTKLNDNFSKIFDILDSLEKDIYDSRTCDEGFSELAMLAYSIRIGIVDKIDNNPEWLLRKNMILISNGFFRVKKYTLENAIEIIVEKIELLASYNSSTSTFISGILEKNRYFNEIESKMGFQQRHQIHNAFE
ncbi:hypothetical protein [Polaribacter staleyi]|uniref:hypothetical protein n=1 Tax=Polaribacter staleyi TaxID=2022337 RepID=UPI0031BA8D4F